MDNQGNNHFVCQFYVVFGKGNMTFPNDGNVYIDADEYKRVEELKTSITNAYKEAYLKYKDRAKLSDKIIFRIPAENYRESAEFIMREVGVTNGEIQVSEKKKEQMTPVAPKAVTQQELETSSQAIAGSPQYSSGLGSVPISKEDPKENVVVQSSSHVETPTPPQASKQEIAPEKKAPAYSYQPDNIYRGDFQRESTENHIDNASAFSNGYGSMRYDEVRSEFKEQRGMARVKKKPNAFVSLPVVIFILSALLLITSAVLLFVLD